MTVAGGFGLMAGVLLILALIFSLIGDGARSWRLERRLYAVATTMVAITAISAIIAIWLWVAGI